MSNQSRKSEEDIKQKIVDGYHRGVCDHNGNTIPIERRGMAGKGSHFSPNLIPTERYRQNYAKIDWSKT